MHSAAPVQLSGLVAPALIPRHVREEAGAQPAPPEMEIRFDKPGTGELRGSMSLLGKTPAGPVVARAPSRGPVRISGGVAAGHLLAPIQPVYPAIAKAAHMEGTVVIEAVISKQGQVERATVVSGSPLLAQAALAAIYRARYEPYKLDGAPVEVETTINVVFTLDN